jgi:hypothetical protein
MRTDARRLAPNEVAFALAWEVHAPGLGGWTVIIDEDEDGSEYLVVDPPLVYGAGFQVRPLGAAAEIIWDQGTLLVENVRAAMLKICPLSPDALAAVEQLADAPTPEI